MPSGGGLPAIPGTAGKAATKSTVLAHPLLAWEPISQQDNCRGCPAKPEYAGCDEVRVLIECSPAASTLLLLLLLLQGAAWQPPAQPAIACSASRHVRSAAVGMNATASSRPQTGASPVPAACPAITFPSAGQPHSLSPVLQPGLPPQPPCPLPQG